MHGRWLLLAAPTLTAALLAAAPAHAFFANGFSSTVTCVQEVSTTHWRATFVATNTTSTNATLTGANNYATTPTGEDPGAPPTSFPAQTEVTWTTAALPKTTPSVTWHLAHPNGVTAQWRGSARCFATESAVANPTVAGTFAPGERVFAVGDQVRLNQQTYDQQIEWRRNCNAIVGDPVVVGTGRGYTIQQADLGTRLQAVITYTEAGTDTVRLALATPCTAATTVRAKPESTTVPHVAGDVAVGSTLSVAGGDWTGFAPLTETAAWEVCSVTACTAVASGPTYTPVAADAGKTVRARVTNTNAYGALTVVTPPSAPVYAPDPTAPAISADVTGEAGAGGWRTGDVTVTWTADDDGSAIDASAGCATVTITTDGHRTLTCSATSRGGTTTETVEVRRDASPPATPAFAGIAARAYTTDTLPREDDVACTAADPTSGATCAVTGWSDAVGTHELTATATNGAGLTSTATRTYEVVAAAPPVTVTTPAPPPVTVTTPAPPPVTVTTPAPPPPRDPFDVLRSLRDIRFSATHITFAQELPGAGRVRWILRTGRRKLGTVRATVRAAGERTVRLRLSPADRRRLAAGRAVTVATAFSPRGGGTLALRQRLRDGR